MAWFVGSVCIHFYVIMVKAFPLRSIACKRFCISMRLHMIFFYMPLPLFWVILLCFDFYHLFILSVCHMFFIGSLKLFINLMPLNLFYCCTILYFTQKFGVFRDITWHCKIIYWLFNTILNIISLLLSYSGYFSLWNFFLT